MSRIPITILFIALLGCVAERSAPAGEPDSSGLSSMARTRIDTPLVATELITEPGGFIHERNWSHTDSVVGEFMRLPQGVDPNLPAVTSDTVSLPGAVRVGRTTESMLKAILGEPWGVTREDGMIVLQYNSPFIGPDESVHFHIRGDTLRQVSWALYSD